MPTSNEPENSRAQDDLYLHVNGEWLRDTEIPDDQSAWGNFHELQQIVDTRLHHMLEKLSEDTDISLGTIESKVRDFYLSGMDGEAAHDSSVAIVEEIFAEIDSCESVTDVYMYLGRAHRRGLSGMWELMVMPDEMESSVFRLRIDQGGLTLPDRDYYDEENNDMVVVQKKFRKHIDATNEATGAESTTVNASEGVYQFEKTLAGASRTQVELRDVEKNYNPYSYSDLQESISGVEWDAYFEGLGLESPGKIIIGQPDFFTSAAKALHEAQIEDIHNYLKWQALASVAVYMGEDMEQLQFDFFGKVLQGSKSMKPRWKRVLRRIESGMGEAIGKMYTDEYFSRESKKKALRMVGHLKDAFAERIKGLEWMEEGTKQYALGKLDKVLIKIGYPDTFLDYQALEITPKSYLQNFLAANEYDSELWFGRVEQEVDRSIWLMNPHAVNAYFSPTTNEITFPSGVLQSPFFDIEASEAKNYGGIGVVIGHELTHGFDDQGSMYDADGNIASWRTQDDKDAFDKRAQVVVRQANSHKVLEDVDLQGELTLGENIADIGGAEMSYRALELDADSRGVEISGDDTREFFFNYARIWRQKTRPEMSKLLSLSDPHAPGDFRVNNTVRNMDSFYTVFNVQPGDGMYLDRDERVDIW